MHGGMLVERLRPVNLILPRLAWRGVDVGQQDAILPKSGDRLARLGQRL
jgi:hypothetical protein